MTSLNAINLILSNLKDDDIALFTTGFISRYAFSSMDRKANFYMIGSMGLVSSVGLGIALNTPKRVFVFDGDGSVLMDMGTLAMIANHEPENLFHIALDNESYESTGGQPTITNRIDLTSIAKAAGYRQVLRVDNKRDLQKRFVKILDKVGPAFALIKVKNAKAIDVGRVSITPQRLAYRIKQTISRRVK